MSLGDNLSGINIEFLQGESADDLKSQLDQIRIPYKIFSIYAQGNRHFAWINTSIPIKKKVKKANKNRS